MKKKGFTLLELMAVVVIISILASIAMPIYTRSIERARAMEAMANIKAINDAVYAYYADKERCPSRFTQLMVSIPGVPGTAGTTGGSSGGTSGGTSGGSAGMAGTAGGSAGMAGTSGGSAGMAGTSGGSGGIGTSGGSGGTGGTGGTSGSNSGSSSLTPDGSVIQTKFFSFALGSAPAVVPGTPCNGVTAVRMNGGAYQYSIMNPYEATNGKAGSLACMDTNAKGQGICDALGI